MSTVQNPAHALFSASGADGWMACAPKLALERGVKDKPNKYAAEGTAAHTLASWALEQSRRVESWLGVSIPVDGFEFTVDADMAGHVQNYVEAVHNRIDEFKLRGAVSVRMLVEIRVDYSRFIGRPDSFGTSDVILLVEWPNDIWQIDVGDLKYGMGVEVSAHENKQMMLYALGALDQFSAVVDATLFSMTIYQPRITSAPDTYECDLRTLMRFADEAQSAALRASLYIKRIGRGVDISTDKFTPGEKQCRWCKVGGTCKARAEKNLSTMADGFVDLSIADTANEADHIKGIVDLSKSNLKNAGIDRLDALYPSLDEIDNWVKAVRGEIEKHAFSGSVFTTCKLVQGKRGNRAWIEEEGAEKLLKNMRLKVDQMYTFKLISPTAAEKLLADRPKLWDKLKIMIGQSAGKLSVVDFSDKRPVVLITPPSDDFDDLGELGELL